METKEIMTRKEAAVYLGISLSQFAATIQPNVKQIRIKRNVRFRKSDIDEYLEKSCLYSPEV